MKKKILIILVSVVTLAIAGGLFVILEKQTPQVVQEEMLVEEQVQNEDVEEVQQELEIDTSNWKTYRNEEYGFEVRMPENFVLENKTPKILDGAAMLSGEKSVFYQKETYEKAWKSIKENPGIPGPSPYADAVRITVRKMPQDRLYEKDFDEWAKHEFGSSLHESGSIEIGDNFTPFIIQLSICSDSSVFFSSDKYIVEFNTCASEFTVDHKPDYFSNILETFRFL